MDGNDTESENTQMEKKGSMGQMCPEGKCSGVPAARQAHTSSVGVEEPKVRPDSSRQTMLSLVAPKRSTNLVSSSHIWPAQAAVERLNCTRFEARGDGLVDGSSSKVVSDREPVTVEQPEQPRWQRDEIGLDYAQPAASH